MSSLYWIAGTWFIISTNFPMWLKGDKTNPTFNYSFTGEGDKEKILDVVKYKKNGKAKSITGYDHLVDKDKRQFVWRGTGLLMFMESNWEIRLVDENKQWAVIWFSKTLFTPEGVDIISRSETMTNAQIEEIKKMMLQDEKLKKHAGELQLLVVSN